MHRSTLIAGIPFAVAAFVMAQGAAAGVTGFRLPPASGSAQDQPEAQGPVAEDVPQSRPTPAQPAPAPEPSPRAAQTPTIVLPPMEPAEPRTAPQPRVTPVPATPQPAAHQPAPAATSASVEPSADISRPEPGIAEAIEAPSPSLVPPAMPTAPAATGAAAATGGWPGWMIGLPGILALLLAGAALWWRANRPMLRPAAVPTIERPTPPSERQPTETLQDTAPPAPAVPQTTGEALQIALQPRKFGLTLMNATLSYRLEIANRGAEPLSGLTVRADMIAAHASLTRDAQLAGPPLDLPPQHVVERLESGESRLVEGEFRLPFPSIVPIRQGSAALLLPLARFHVEADGAAPLIRIFIVGQPGTQPDAALVPFRLDQGPRIYPQPAQRAFA